MKRFLPLFFLCAFISSAFAQTSPNLITGQKLTAAQWNALFAGKQDTLGYVPLNTAGGVLSGRLVTAAPGTLTAGLNLTPGSTPGSPVDGDIWFTSSGMFARVNGGTLSIGSSSGTVQSVAMTVPSIFSIGGSPITLSGTLALGLANQNANQFFAGPSSGGATTPTFRALAFADFPSGFVVAGLGLTGGNLLGNGTIALDKATAANYYAGASNKTPTTDVIYPTETTTTFGATTTFDFSTFINTQVTLTANITTQTLSNVIAGKAGTIRFIQSGAGNFTTVWNSIFKFAGGSTPTLTTGSATAIDVLNYNCITTTYCQASLAKDVK